MTVEPLINKAERLLGDFARDHGFTMKAEGDQLSTFGCQVTLESKEFIIYVGRDRGQESIMVALPDKKRSLWPLVHLIGYIKDKEEPYSMTNLETETKWLIDNASRVLDPSLLLSRDLGAWATRASRKMWKGIKKNTTAQQKNRGDRE